jgi:hypothetical protein
VSLLYRINRRIFNICLAFAAGGIFAGCLDIPDAVDDSSKITKIDVLIKQFGETSSEPLKVNANSKAELIADVYPEKEKKRVKFYWYIDEDILDSGSTYKISTTFMSSTFFSENFIPNKLVVKDHEGSILQKEFHVTVNTPPEILPETIPADGDILYGNSSTPFTFAWSSSDRDANDRLENILEIDGISYHVGELNQVVQSGFSMGKHTFRIIVEDNLGDKDSLPEQEFIVLDTLEYK